MPDTTPTTPADELRTAVADAIARVDSGSWGSETASMHPYWRDGYLRYADAALAAARQVLGTTAQPPAPAEACTEHGAACHTRQWPTPGTVTTAPVDRAAVLRDAADRMWALANRTTERGSGVLWAAEWLRRMADEAQQPETEAAKCTYCGGSGVDPEDEGDWVPGVHMHDPGSRGPCPKCNGTCTEPAADRPDTETEAPRLPWADLLGAAPDITGGACTQCYMDRARDRDHDMSPEHAHCRTVLDEPDTETEAAK